MLRVTIAEVIMNVKWLSLLKMWIIVAVILSHTVTANHLSGNGHLPFFTKVVVVSFVL